MPSLLGIAVKDPAINNQLSDLHDAHEVASGTIRRARTAIMMLDLLRTKFDSNDFVYRFLHLIDFVEFEQPKSMSALDFIEDYHRRVARLKSAYTKDGVFDNAALNGDLFTAMFYAKVDKSLRKALGPHISSLTDATFKLDELTEWVERNVTMADHEHSGRTTDIVAKAAIFGDIEDDDEDDDGTAYYGRAGGGTGKPIPCKICGSLDHRKSEHPGPCPLNLKAAPGQPAARHPAQ